jgi:hypothetical protein
MSKKPTLADVFRRLEQERPPLLDLLPMIVEALGNDPKLIQAFAVGVTGTAAPPELLDTLPKDPRNVH